MTIPTHRRALCPHCKRVCEQTATTEFVGGRAVPSRTCIECLTTYADDPHDEPAADTTPNGCPLCGGEVVRRTVRDPSGAELPATDCVDCEQLCLSTRVATAEERVESERNKALEEQCTMLSASLRQRDREVRTLESQLVELDAKLRAAEAAKDALTAQLLHSERVRSSLRPPPSDAPCKHCGDAELSVAHLTTRGHSYEAPNG